MATAAAAIGTALLAGAVGPAIDSTVDQIEDLYATGSDLFSGRTGLLEASGNVIKDTLGNATNLIIGGATQGRWKPYKTNEATSYLPQQQAQQAQQPPAQIITQQLANNTDNPSIRQGDRGMSFVNLPDYKYGSELDLIDPQSVNMRRAVEQIRAIGPMNSNVWGNNFLPYNNFVNQVLPPEGTQILAPSTQFSGDVQPGVDFPIGGIPKASGGIEEAINAPVIANRRKAKPKARAKAKPRTTRQSKSAPRAKVSIV